MDWEFFIKTTLAMIAKNIFFILCLMILLLAIKIPLEQLFLILEFDAFSSNYIAGIICRLLIIFFSIFLIIKYDFLKINGINKRVSLKNMQAIIFPFLIMGAILNSHIAIFKEADTSHVIIFIVFTLSVGFAEELVFRGTILPMLIKKFGKINTSVLITSALFGLIHYINVVYHPELMDKINSKVIFAFSMGVFFSGLFLRTGNIIIASLLHFFFNVSAGAGELKKAMVDNIETTLKDIDDFSLSSVLITLFLYGLIAMSGLIMIELEGKEKILSEFLGTNE